MSDRLSRIEDRLKHVDDAIARLAERLERLEAGAAHAPILGTVDLEGPAGRRLTVQPRSDAVLLLTLVGRTFVVFGGAYLLRALTESGQMVATSGVLLGLLYAVLWLAAADRASRTSALFHGVSTVLIGLPIIWEASTRFHFFSPATAALAVAVIAGLALAVAAHRRMPALAAVGVIGALGTSFALVVALGRLVPFAVLLLAVALGVLWIGYARRWIWLAAIAALAADLAVVGATARGLTIPPRDPVAVVLALQASLLVIYLGSFAVRSLWLRHPLGVGEFVQGALVLALGLGGAIAVTQGNAAAWTTIGAVTIAGAIAAYASAFESARAARSSDSTFYFFTTLGLVLALTGSRLLLSAVPLSIVLSAAAVTAMALAVRLRTSVIALHAAFALLMACGPSGLLSLVVPVWVSGLTDWPGLPVPAWIVVAAAFLSFVVAIRTAGDGGLLFTTARTAVGALTIAGLGTFLVVRLGPSWAGTPPDPGSLATLKSLVLAASAVLVAWTKQVPGLTDLGRLTYPILIAGGLKIVFDDFRWSRPSTLFIAFALYGAALIAAPRMLRRGRTGGTDEARPTSRVA